MQHTLEESRRYALLGHSVVVSATRPASGYSEPWLDRLDSLLSGFHSEGRPGRQVAHIRVRAGADGADWRIDDGDAATTVHNANAVLREVEWRVVAAAAKHAALPLLLHAGAVARGGIALLLPAASGSGKTSLTLALALRGWLPLTDDICPLEPIGDAWFALPCPRCCHLSVDMVDILGPHGIALEGPVAELHGYYRPTRWAEGALVRAVAVPHFAADALPRRTRLTQAECLAELISATYEHARHPRAEQRLAARHLATRAPGFRLTYASVDEALRLVEDLVGEMSGEQPAPSASHLAALTTHPA